MEKQYRYNLARFYCIVSDAQMTHKKEMPQDYVTSDFDYCKEVT